MGKFTYIFQNAIEILGKYNFMTRPFFVFLMSNVITPDVVAIVSAIPVQYICESYLLATIADF